jgi:hypothetical protein
MSRFAVTEEIEIGEMAWLTAEPLVKRAWELGIWASYY